MVDEVSEKSKRKRNSSEMSDDKLHTLFMPSPPAAFAASDCSSSVFAQCGLTVSCETVVFFSVPLGTAARFDSYSHAVHLTRPVSDDVSIEPHWGQKGNAKDIRRFRGGD